MLLVFNRKVSMKKVHSMVKKESGLVYPSESSNHLYESLLFYVEENNDGSLDDAFELEADTTINRGEWEGSKNQLILKRVQNSKKYVSTYKDCELIFKVTSKKQKYVGGLTGPQKPIRLLTVKKDPNKLFDVHGVVILGHTEIKK